MDLLSFALELVQAGGKIIMEAYYATDLPFEVKEDGTIVTLIDRKVEQKMRQMIQKAFPDHAIWGEEFGGEVTPEYTWVIDPIDGTSAFFSRKPTFGTLVALLKEGRPILGAMYFPATEELLYAAQGEGCWYEHPYSEEKVRMLVQRDRPEPMILTHSDNIRSLLPLESLGKLHAWGDCGQYLALCRGNADVVIDPIMKPWYIGALLPCIKEAGGIVTDLQGNPASVSSSGIVASVDPELHAQIIAALNAR